MATQALRINQTGWNPILMPIIQLVEDHPAFYPLLDLNGAEKMLLGAHPMTYILWKDDQNQRYFLSFMNTFLAVEHRFFTKDAGCWLYQNGDPHRVPSIELLVPIIMHCKKASQCQMLRNPAQVKR